MNYSFFPSLFTFINCIITNRLAMNAARAVHYLHSLNPPVLHRDLKSPNFLVSKNSKNSIDLKLTDFGMSKVKSIASNVSNTVSTNTGMIIYHKYLYYITINNE